MKLTLSYPLYRRKDASNNIAPVGFLMDGSILEISDVVIGKSIDGNSIWYKADDGLYYWSGGINEVEFRSSATNFTSLSLELQFSLISQALKYYYSKYNLEGYGITGCSISLKHKDAENRYLDHYAIVIHVAFKSDNAVKKIPSEINYKGFNIPTDVIEGNYVVACSLGKNAISRNEDAHPFGSPGFIAIRNNEKYLVTNYHVLCDDLLKQGHFNITEAFTFLDNCDVVMPSRGNQESMIIGLLTDACLDFHLDAALVKLDSDLLTNEIESIGKISGIRIFKPPSDTSVIPSIRIQLFGARSQKKITGSMKALKTIQPIRYNHNIMQQMEDLYMAEMEEAVLEGDSGSAILDEDRALIGILVGKEFSGRKIFILPVEHILKNFRLNTVL
jgi:hypothetical protein